MKNKIAGLSMILIIAGFAPGCDTINDKIGDSLPEIGISDGVLGLDGETGTAATGTFAAGKTGGVAATGTLNIPNKSFKDVDAGDFADLRSIVADIGLAVESGGIAMWLNKGTGDLPATLTVTSWDLDWLITDAAHTGAAGFGTPPGFVSPKNTTVTFTRVAGCAATAASCAYSTTNGAALTSIFQIDATQDAYLNLLEDIIFMPTGGTNTQNTLNLSLTLTVSESAAALQGITATVKVAEYGTTVTSNLF